MSRPAFLPDWSGETVVIVASGPSAASAPVSLARGLARVIAVNESWRLAPWADALWGCDVDWWDHAGGAPEFAGLKFTVDARAAEHWPDLRLVPVRRPHYAIVQEPIGTVGWGGNGGFQAVNFAAHAGARRILLVGFDMSIRGGLHWHGPHPGAMANPRAGNVGVWRRTLDGAAAALAAMGVEVVNCSEASTLRAYPKAPLEAALGRAAA